MGAEFEIPSNCGRYEVRGSVARQRNDASDTLYALRVTASGRYWDRFALAPEGDCEDFSATLGQAVVSKTNLVRLWEHLDRWMNSQEEFECALSVPADDQRLSIALRIVPGVICSSDKPVCIVSYSAFHLLTEVSFVVDQSCVRIFRDSLRALL